MTYSYEPQGICAKEITLEVEDGILRSVKMRGGCPGNRRALASLLAGMRVEEIIRKLEGTPCGERGTSCPDQIAQALKQLNNESK